MNPKRPLQAVDGGFTLIELLIVVTVIGILVAIAIPGLLNAFDKTKQTATSALIRAFGQSLEVYNTDNHSFPLATDIAALVPVLRPYSDTLRPDDNWKHALSYRTDGEHYTLESFGKDGVDGADVTPHTRYTFTLDLVMVDGNWVANIE